MHSCHAIWIWLTVKTNIHYQVICFLIISELLFSVSIKEVCIKIYFILDNPMFLCVGLIIYLSLSGYLSGYTNSQLSPSCALHMTIHFMTKEGLAGTRGEQLLYHIPSSVSTLIHVFWTKQGLYHPRG